MPDPQKIKCIPDFHTREAMRDMSASMASESEQQTAQDAAISELESTVADLQSQINSQQSNPILSVDLNFSTTISGPVLKSPNGSKWRLTVTNVGLVVAVSVP